MTRSLLLVNRVVLTADRLLPLYPDKPTFSAPVGMSQRCHERRNALQQRAPLFDHLVGKYKDRIRDGQPDRLRGSEIDDHLELRGLLHG
jgi:hypothetical protein